MWVIEKAPFAHRNEKYLGKNPQQITQKLFQQSLSEFKWQIVIKIFSFQKHLQRNFKTQKNPNKQKILWFNMPKQSFQVMELLILGT